MVNSTLGTAGVVLGASASLIGAGSLAVGLLPTPDTEGSRNPQPEPAIIVEPVGRH